MLIGNNLNRVNADKVYKNLKTKGKFDKDEFADMYWSVLTLLDRKGIYIVEDVVAKIMDDVMRENGYNWDSESIEIAISSRYD